MLLYRYLTTMLLFVFASCKQESKQTALFAAPLNNTQPKAVIEFQYQEIGALGALRDQLPEQLINLLNKKHAGWELPDITETNLKTIRKHKQGPYYLTGDFNGDMYKDYAVQIEKNNTVQVLAFISKNKTFQEVKIREAQAIKKGKQKQSIFYLNLSEKYSELYNYSTDRKETLPEDAITVGTEQSVTTYVYKNNKFYEILTSNEKM